MKTQIIGGIILLVLGGLFAKYKIFDDKVELKYSLSETIPSDFSNNLEESGIQQLTVKNSGDLMVNSITVKVDFQILDYKIKKFKSTDSTIVTKNKSYLEIIYPELPPTGEIIVLLKSTGKGLTTNNIEIFHNKGVAKEAFTNNDSFSSWFFLIISLIYLLFIFGGIRNILSESIASRASYSPVEILKKEKPWFIKDSKWSEIRKKAINNYVNGDTIFSIENSNLYIILNSSKYDYLSNDEWHEVKNLVEKKLENTIIEKIYRSYFDSSFEELSNLNKPLNISHNIWKKIFEEVSKAYCIHKLKEILSYENRNRAFELLKSEKPKNVENDDWLNLKNIIESFYISEIIKRGISTYDYEKYIQETDLENIQSTNKEQIIELFQKLRTSKETKDYYENLKGLFREMFIWDSIPKQPDFIKKEDWERIKELYIRVFETRNKSSEELLEANQIKEEYLPVKEKVVKQLEIIEKVLSDSKFINKIEDYDNPFKEGNWENLVKIAKLLDNK